LGITLRGYFFVLLMYGLFATVSLQKSVRDKLEGIPVTAIYFGLCWFSVVLVIVLLAIGLWNTEGLANGERDFTQCLSC
ncbi:MAG: YiaA/YiaB family inner membrane protein, partial [Pseudomonadales bacterium]